jgi:hypothetical protein
VQVRVQQLVQVQPQELVLVLVQQQARGQRWHRHNPQPQLPVSRRHHASRVRWCRFSRQYRLWRASCQ